MRTEGYTVNYSCELRVTESFSIVNAALRRIRAEMISVSSTLYQRPDLDLDLPNGGSITQVINYRPVKLGLTSTDTSETHQSRSDLFIGDFSAARTRVAW